MIKGNIELPSSLVFWPSSNAPVKNGLEVGLGVVKGLRLGEGEGEGVGEGLSSGTARSSAATAGRLCTVRRVVVAFLVVVVLRAEVAVLRWGG